MCTNVVKSSIFTYQLKRQKMTLQDLKNNREEIITFISQEVGQENVKRVMERMTIFFDTTNKTTVIDFAKECIDDMSLIKKMESRDSHNTRSLNNLIAEGKIEEYKK